MAVIKLVLAYDGTGFRGWARQRGGLRTVQGVLEESLGRILGRVPDLSAAGRTDAGVHARGQVVSFAADADPVRIQRSLNRMLAPEVVVMGMTRAPNGFDARLSATAREYRYRIDTGPWPDPFTARFVWHRVGELSVPAMRRAASFCRARTPPTSTVRRMERLSVSVRGDRVEIGARANAFCHQMMRSLVGTLLSVGTGQVPADSMPAVLEARDRAAAAQMAPAHGLTLERVRYGGSPSTR